MLVGKMRNPLIRHILLLAAGVLCLVLVAISLMAQTEAAYQRRLRLVRHSSYHRRNGFRENEDEFNGEPLEDGWRPLTPVIPDGVVLHNSPNGQSIVEKNPAHFGVTELPKDGTPTYGETLMTLFTTMKNTNNRTRIHVNTIRNWASLIPYIMPVLFVENTTNSEWIEQAESLGWRIRKVRRWNQGIPVLRSMFEDVLETYSTPFYGYANADILFDWTLLSNLEAFVSYGDRISKLFVIGKRWNINASNSALSRLSTSNLTLIADIGRKNGSLFLTNAQDYFITTRRGFPWHKVPDLVVGRAGYDNWLVVKAQEWNMTVVDASYTIMAIHQTGRDGNRAGWAQKEHRCINREIIGRFNFTRGHTKCVPYISYIDLSGKVKIFRRPKISRDCDPRYRRVKYTSLMGCV